HAALDDRSLGGDVVGDRVLPLGVPGAEVFGQDLATAARDPMYAGVAQPCRRVRVRQAGTIGEEHELCNRQRVELDPLAIAVAPGGKEGAVGGERGRGVNPPDEGDEAPPELDHFVYF